MVEGWRERARRLAAQLQADGVLDPGWLAAFAEVPRHLFVPSFQDEDGVVGPEQRERWLDAVYSDSTLVTRTAQVPGTDLRWPTSSSTRPSLMATMLGLLDISGTERVLEIGTGTGYNAALLCHRLTDTRVTSIDLDGSLVAAARPRLAAAGHRPRLATADGRDGFPPGAPYDRIIATAAVPAVPPAWITQLAPDGLVVADLRGEIAGSLVVLRRTEAGTVEGRFLGQPGHFMWLRAEAGNPLPRGGRLRTEFSLGETRRRTTDVAPTTFDEPGPRFLLQLLDPDLHALYAEGGTVRLEDGDGARVDVGTVPDRAGRYPVTEIGDRALWRTAERAARLWWDLGRPAVSRFGLTARADGTRTVWLDGPDRWGQPLEWM